MLRTIVKSTNSIINPFNSEGSNEDKREPIMACFVAILQGKLLKYEANEMENTRLIPENMLKVTAKEMILDFIAMT